MSEHIGRPPAQGIKSWDSRLASLTVAPLAKAGIHPNTVTTWSLLLAVAAGVLFSFGTQAAMNWGGGLFVLARFVDHIDGELARVSGKSSRFGSLYDGFVGGISYIALFIGLGLGLSGLEDFEYAHLADDLAMIASVAVVITTYIDLMDEWKRGVVADYPSAGGLELEDGIYLVGPLTWIGWIGPFFVLCALGTVVYAIVTMFLALRRHHDHGTPA